DLNIETDTIEYNSNIHSMFGYKENEIDNVNSWWRDKIHPEDIETVNNALTEVIKKGKERFQMEYRFKAADGSYKFIFDRAFVIKDENDEPVRMIGAMQDISHEVEEQERLKLLESVITNTKESVVITEAVPTDLQGRKILYVNEAFSTLTGYEKEEAIGKTIHFLNGPETDKATRAELGSAMDRHEAKEVEFINYKKNGEKFWINISIVPVADDDGNYTHWVAIGRDITDQKQNEEEIKASLKEKETLLAEIHHRVKNNLAVVSGMMQLQAFDSHNEELQAKLFDSVVRIKSIATVHELLYQSNSFSQLDFSDTLKKLIENISETLQNTTDITLDINCDPVQLNINQAIPASLIVNEVITNAYKHAFKGTKDNRLSFDLSENENSIHIEIKDNGVGLPDDKIMETKNSLGFHLIEVLCGQIDGVKEYKNGKKGTIFTLTFTKNETKSGSANAQMN
ncbi:MAG TPA: PAS domain-containing protein, partial [Gracilimonas sp.]|uniref:PAS domain-containing protein n=1 Tax=Gracilimonas sp. TaxID=1974203 RepID=UPI002D9F97B1|nr:PAS domain-containing protein [Gracilimonas sp.]